MKKKEYREIDIEELATTLAEMAWEAETKHIKSVDLYDYTIDSTGTMKKDVAPYWATLFFQLKDKYRLIITQFERDDTEQKI